mmetsp:Transcript_69354/g.104600  ORF Transcript_69354/g.104600 Transcript_69354/m.104600 type:complete len:104 (-) Transcript_69354:1977-2288(-)
MSEYFEEKPPHPKCADAIEFGQTFGKYSRLNKKQFAILLDEKTNHEGMVYRVKRISSSENKFTVRLLRPKPEGILLAMWKTGKISFLSDPSQKNFSSVEIRKK